MSIDRETLNQMDVDLLSNDKKLTNQILKSRENRNDGHIYDKEKGLRYLHSKIEEFESGQKL